MSTPGVDDAKKLRPDWWRTSARIPVILAPMAGISDGPYRRICRDQGADGTVTEMVSTDGLVRDNRNAWEMLRDIDHEPHTAVQFFGRDPDSFAGAVRCLASKGIRPVALDVNMGCPVPKVVRSGAGAALMTDPEAARAVVSSLVSAVRACGYQIPVWVKIRSGWDAASINAPDVARVVAEAGADGITVHARTRSQYYSGEADWRVIADVVEAVNIPVFGNGDIASGEDVARMVEATGCHGVMIGRAALGAPWIFGEVVAYLEGRASPRRPEAVERMALLARHLEMERALRGSERSARFMRKHVHWYTSGLPDSAALRNAANHCRTSEELRELLEDYSREVLGSVIRGVRLGDSGPSGCGLEGYGGVPFEASR